MDPRIQEYLEGLVPKDERDIQVLGESQNDVDKLENYLKMYIMQEKKYEKESAEKYRQMNQASQDEKVDWTRMTQQWPDTPERATGRGRGWSTQMYTPMNQASQSEDVGGNHMSEAVKHLLGIGKVRYAVTQMPSPMNQQALMNQASQSEDVGGNHMSEAVKHVIRIGNACYDVTQIHSPMDQQTEAEVNRLLYSIFMLEQSYVKARNKHANCEEVQSKLDELYKLENYLKNIKGADPQGLYEVKNRLKKILEHAKKISEADEKSNVSARIYTPMQQASQAEGVDWNRMTQIAQRASESGILNRCQQKQVTSLVYMTKNCGSCILLKTHRLTAKLHLIIRNAFLKHYK